MAEKSSQVKNVYQRLIEVQKVVQSVKKNETVETGQGKSYKGVSHDDVAALLHMPLAEAGIAVIPTVTDSITTEFELKNKYGDIKKWYKTDLQINVKYVNVDDPEDFFESNGKAFAIDSGDKGPAKAYSLALKIILLKVHMLESYDQEEQRNFENENEKENQKKPIEKSSQLEKPKAKPKNFAPQSQSHPETEVQRFADETPPPPPQDHKKKDDPGHYVIPFGQNIAGKRVSELNETTLKEVLKWCEGQMKLSPPAKGLAVIIETQSKIKAFLNSVGVS